MHPIFAIDLILDQIFINLPPEDIFKCTRVNRLWNLRCRTILRDRHRAIARLTGSCPCKNVTDFQAFLHSLASVPYYNGIHLKIDGHLHKNCQTGSSAIYNDNYIAILNLQIKYLTVDWTRASTNCLAANLLNSLIQLKSEDLEEVNVMSIPKNVTIPAHLNFGKLETLKVADELSLDYLARPFLATIISNGKNLKHLYSTPLTPVQALQYLPEDRLQIIKDLAFSPETVLDEILYSKFALLRPHQLSSLMISSPNHEEDLCVENCWESLRQILVSCQHSLKLLSLDTRAALMLAVLKAPPLTNVTTLLLDVDLSLSAFNVREQLKLVNFGKLFPNLSAISVSNDMILVNELPYYTNLDIDSSASELNLSSNITALDVTFGEFSKESVRFLAEFFGNVRFLSIWCTGVVPYEELWSRWTQLETIWVSQSDACILKNCDAEFCGITPEEVAELSQKDQEYLKAVHVVPVKPSVTHLKDLKEIQMTIYSGRSEDEYIASERFLSKVTQLVAFGRMPGLQVSITSQYL